MTAGLARRALALLATDPAGLGGVSLASSASPGRDAWIAALHRSMGSDRAHRRLPLSITEDRLLGGLDLVATLANGRPVKAQGLLVEANGGTITLASAERLSGRVASVVAAAMDSGLVDGSPARFTVVALDEAASVAGADEDERLPDAIAERIAFRLDASMLDTIPTGLVIGMEVADHRDGAACAMSGERAPESVADFVDCAVDHDEIRAARLRLTDVAVPDDILGGLTAAAVALGIQSLRAPLFAVRAARASAALEGRTTVAPEDAQLAAALVLAHRATRLPALDDTAPEDDPQPLEDPEPLSPQDPGSETDPASDPADETPPADLLIAAARAAIPPGLLAKLQGPDGKSRNAVSSSRTGAVKNSLRHGRPVGSRPGDPRRGGRLDLVATLRRAAPWQAFRRRERGSADAESSARLRQRSDGRRIEVRLDDLVIRRHEEKMGTLLIFAVDASGSAALSRLAEAKGAVELLLADCYSRRDEVAVLAFRGMSPDLLLPPTRALARAKRALAELPGGGATPLAAALDLARDLAAASRRRGRKPALVVLTDGRANVTRDGRTGRSAGEADALAAAAILRADRTAALVIDTSDRPQPQASELASALGGRLLVLPRADAGRLSKAVQAGLPRE